jgi:ribonuclease P protein component
VVSRKVHKSAVARNRMRRRLYAALQEFEPQINAPYDIVLTVFQETLLEEPPNLPHHQLKETARGCRHYKQSVSTK